MKLLIPFQILSRNKLDQKHWSVRHKYSKQWEWAIAATSKRNKALSKRSVVITSYRRRLLDQDNLVGGCKGLVDALKRLEFIVNDDPSNVEVTYKQIVVKMKQPEFTEIIIEDIS